MAHVGKVYPRYQPYDLSLKTIDEWCPPRKLYFTVSNLGTNGTLAPPWQNLTILSPIGDYDVVNQTITYRFDHPTVPDNYLLAIWDVYHLVSPIPSNRRPAVRITVEFWFDGLKYGDVTNDYSGAVFLGVAHLAIQWQQWLNRLDTSKLWITNLCKIFAGTWAQQPEYHPYRE